MGKILGHYALTYLPEHTIRKYYSTFSTSSYIREADMSAADRSDMTLSGPKIGDMLCRFGDMLPTCWPTRHCCPKIVNTDIRHSQLSCSSPLLLLYHPFSILFLMMSVMTMACIIDAAAKRPKGYHGNETLAAAFFSSQSQFCFLLNCSSAL